VKRAATNLQVEGRWRAAAGICAARRRRGFALIPALFLIVVLGALAVVAVRVGTGQQQAVIMSLMEARALAAAQAGIEWGAYQSVGLTPAGVMTPQPGSCAASATLSLTEASLSGFTVIVTCSVTPYANGAGIGYSYVLKSTASIGTYGQPGYVRRVVSGTYTSAT
jgi:MSHA biogenesis protein MshP